MVFEGDVIAVWKSVTRATGVAAITAAVAVMWPAMATAAGPGADFGQHVRTCAQTMGFDSTHNPGTHHGFAGWDSDHVC
jgi:hypothetical protein